MARLLLAPQGHPGSQEPHRKRSGNSFNRSPGLRRTENNMHCTTYGETWPHAPGLGGAGKDKSSDVTGKRQAGKQHPLHPHRVPVPCSALVSCQTMVSRDHGPPQSRYYAASPMRKPRAQVSWPQVHHQPNPLTPCSWHIPCVHPTGRSSLTGDKDRNGELAWGRARE